MKLLQTALIFGGLAVGAFIVYRLISERNTDPVDMGVEQSDDAYQGRITLSS